jgi:hypothetical protein
VNRWTWWNEWGSTAATLVGLTFGLIGTALGAWNAWRAHREHSWKSAEREDAAKRRERCIAWRKVLADPSTTAIAVDGKFLDWALWGQANGYFKVRQLLGDKLELTSLGDPDAYPVEEPEESDEGDGDGEK